MLFPVVRNKHVSLFNRKEPPQTERELMIQLRQQLAQQAEQQRMLNARVQFLITVRVPQPSPSHGTVLICSGCWLSKLSRCRIERASHLTLCRQPCRRLWARPAVHRPCSRRIAKPPHWPSPRRGQGYRQGLEHVQPTQRDARAGPLRVLAMMVAWT